MLRDRTIQKLVKEQATSIKATITADELFTSQEYARHVQSLVDTTTGRYDLPVVVELKHQDPNMTAFTDGNHIYQDTRSSLAYCFESIENKYMANIGTALHECAHILFLDFDGEKKCLHFVADGMFYGKEPEPKNQKEAANLAALKNAMAQEIFKPLFQEIYSEILNRLDDPHDEDALIDRFGGFVQRAIQVLREGIWMKTPPIEHIVDEMEKGTCSKMEAMYSAILMFARFGQLVSSDPEHVMQTEIGKKLSEMSKDIMLGRYTHSTVERSGYVNNIVFALWPWIQEELSNQEKKGSQGSQDQSLHCDPSQDAIQQVLEQLRKSAQNSSGTAAPKNRMSSKESKKLSQEPAQELPKQTTSQVNGVPRDKSSKDSVAKKMVGKVLSEIANQAAERQVQEQITTQTNLEISAVDQNSTHRGIPIRVIPQTKIDEDTKRYYMEEMAPLIGLSKNLQRHMRDALRDIQDGDVTYHKFFGNSFEVRDAYRPDERFFSQKRLPQDIPNMALSILVDHSGSMRGKRIEAAMQTTMLLHDFATNLEIPTCVLGHATSGMDVEIYTYTEFLQVASSEKYRLAKMCAGGNNRDGLAIEIAAGLLAKRPEEIKLLIILSDGQPNHNGYGGSEAVKDIQKIVKKYRKRGIEIIATAIGGDKERIKDIYGEGSFLDIENLERLPKMLAKIVQKRILKN